MMIKVMMKKRIHHILGILNLSLDGRLRLCFFDEGGGVDSIYTIFICKNNRKSIKITHCVEIIFLGSSLKDMDFFAIDR